MRYTIAFCLATLIATQAAAEVPKVVTDIVPVHALVATVMGDLGRPELLLPKGADDHDFQLRPSQAQLLAEADLLVWVGPELSPWLERAQTSIGKTDAQLALLDAPGTDLIAYAKSDEGDHAEEDHAHDDHAADDHAADDAHQQTAADTHDDDHDHGANDPHAWLDPGNAALWLDLIADRLGVMDPANAAAYLANAATGKDQIAAADARITTLLAQVKGSPFLVFHDAYGYFTRHYGLTMAGAIREGDATAPGAARLQALRELAASNQAVCLFPEANHDPAQALQLAEGTGIRLGRALDPAGTMLDPAPTAYVTLIETMAQNLSDCLGAS